MKELHKQTPRGLAPKRRQYSTSKQYPTRRQSASQQSRNGFAFLLATLPDEQRAELRDWLDSVKALPGDGGAR